MWNWIDYLCGIPLFHYVSVSDTPTHCQLTEDKCYVFKYPYWFILNICNLFESSSIPHIISYFLQFNISSQTTMRVGAAIIFISLSACKFSLGLNEQQGGLTRPSIHTCHSQNIPILLAVRDCIHVGIGKDTLQNVTFWNVPSIKDSVCNGTIRKVARVKKTRGS